MPDSPQQYSACFPSPSYHALKQEELPDLPSTAFWKCDHLYCVLQVGRGFDWDEAMPLDETI